MDFAQAGLVVVVVYVAMKWIDNDLSKKALPSVVKIPLAMAIGIGTLFLVGATVWAHEQVIGGHTLDNLDGASKVVAGILLGAASTGLDTVFKTARNIGQNDTP